MDDLISRSALLEDLEAAKENGGMGSVMASTLRLIDANHLNEKMIPNCPIEEGGIPLPDFATHIKILEMYPTVDAVPVVHGRWQVSEEYNTIIKMNVVAYTCSACGQTRLSATSLSQATKYCPNCGAKMDGGNDG